MPSLIDSYNRRINYLRISVTDRCNLSCLYCMPTAGISPKDSSKILSYEEILRIAKIASDIGITKVRITGGEPLIRKDIVFLIASLAKIKGIKDLSITTNGTLLSNFAHDLFNAGLKRINVSLDSLRPKRYQAITGKDMMDKVLEGIHLASGIGFCPIKINVVILRGLNDDEIWDFASLTFEFPYQIRFIEFMPIGEENIWQKDKFISSREIREVIEKKERLYPFNSQKADSVANLYKFSDAKGEIGFISPLTEHFCLSCNRLRLTSEGKIRTCLFSNEEMDIKNLFIEGMSNEEIKEFLRDAIKKKPEGHRLDLAPTRKCLRPMSTIGG